MLFVITGLPLEPQGSTKLSQQPTGQQLSQSQQQQSEQQQQQQSTLYEYTDLVQRNDPHRYSKFSRADRRNKSHSRRKGGGGDGSEAARLRRGNASSSSASSIEDVTLLGTSPMLFPRANQGEGGEEERDAGCSSPRRQIIIQIPKGQMNNVNNNNNSLDNASGGGEDGGGEGDGDGVGGAVRDEGGGGLFWAPALV